MKTLKKGMTHPDVSKLKQLLKAAGVGLSLTGTDYFGSLTDTAVHYFQSTHLGEDRKYLLTDGVVGPKTWWALENSSGEAQKSNIEMPVPMNARGARYGMFSELRQQFIFQLFHEYSLDVKEVPDGSNTGPIVKKYLANYGPVAWCALFISWGYKQVTGHYPLNAPQAHVKTGWNLAKERGRTIRKQDGPPIPGNLAVWDFGGGNGHVAAIVAVSPDNKRFNTIAGNEGNRVKLGLRTTANEPSLVGWIDLFGDNPPTDFLHDLLEAKETAALSSEGSR